MNEDEYPGIEQLLEDLIDDAKCYDEEEHLREAFRDTLARHLSITEDEEKDDDD